MTDLARRQPAAPNPSSAAARVLLDELARNGLRHVVLCPGSRSTALAVAAYEHPDLLLHVEVDERSAGYLAVGIARASGVPAAVIVTSGTAVANLLPAVVEADHDRVPLLLLTADRPPESHGVGANQTIEQVGIFGDSPRLTVDLGVPGELPAEVARWRWTACRAFGVAVGEPVETPAVVGLDTWREPGPVHLNLPFREPTVPASDDGRTAARPFMHPLDGRRDGATWAEPVGPRHAATEHAVEVAAELLAGAARGLVVVGGAVVGQLGPLAALADALGWPVLREPHAPSVSGAIRCGSLVLGSGGFTDGRAPDLVLRVGRVTVSRELALLLERTPQVVVDPHGGWVSRDDESVDLLRGEVAGTVAALLARIEQSERATEAGWRESWRTLDETISAAVDGVLDGVVDGVGDGVLDAAPPAPLTEPRVVRDVLAAVPAGSAVVVGSSMPIRDLDLVGAVRRDVVVHANRGVSGIDGVVSTALGVALAHGAPTVLVCGDLTLLHDSNAWLLSPDAGGSAGDLVVVAIDNDGGGIFSFLPQRTHVEGFERLFGTPHGRDLGHLAALHGLTLHRPSDPAGLVESLEAGVSGGGRHLIVVTSDRAANVEVHRALRAAVADALD